jgi:hypothetical protein
MFYVIITHCLLIINVLRLIIIDSCARYIRFHMFQSNFPINQLIAITPSLSKKNGSVFFISSDR